ncbi:MAG: zinc ribbon domain-containing protein [Eubacterium sp.]
MNCKNCGAKINSKDRECPNCGASITRENGYVLSFAKDEKYDYDDEPPKRRNNFKGIIALILIAALIVGGEYYYFGVYKKKDVQPQVNFSYGAGLINSDQQIVYVALDEYSKIEYINGVSLYGYDRTSSGKNNDSPLSTDYEYTKSISGIFRAIFFDLEDFDIEKGKDYTYTFEMTFSFYDNSNQYTYTQVVNFSGSAEEDVSDIVFDHSMKTDVPTAESTTQPPETTVAATEKTTEPSSGDASFLYSGFWYTDPYHDGDNYSIDAIQLSQNGGCTITSYNKTGSANWTTTQKNTGFSIKGDVLTIDGDGDYIIDYGSFTVAGLTQRKYNSIKNTEDFFGM